MKALITILILFFACFGANAQTILRGTVKDSTHVLEGATVRLYRDSVAVRQTRSTVNGFVFGKVNPGRYLLKIGFTGYVDLRKEIVVRAKDSLLLLGVFQMLQGTDSSLVEVVVKATIPPVLLKKDTVVYNAAAYKLRPNASVEELLKRLPGMSVEKDGSITLNGKKVEKIYIEGKEFMLNDPKIVTQGFNADMISTVEAFDNTSEGLRFTGVRDLNAGTALNFKLKKQFRNSTFGTLYGGGDGAAQRYVIGARADRMIGDSWISAAFNGNTINSIYNGAEQNISSIPAGNNRHWVGRLNFVQGQSFNSGFALNDDLREQQTIRDRETFLNDSSLVQHSENSLRDYVQKQELNLRVRFKIDSMSSFELTSSGAYNKSESSSSDHSTVNSKRGGVLNFLSDANSLNASSGNNYSGNASLSFRHRFRQRGRYLVLSFAGNAGNTKKDNSIRNLLVTNAGVTILDQRSVEKSPLSGFGFSSSYTQPIKPGHVIDINYGVNRSNRTNDRVSRNYNPATGMYDIIDTLTTNEIHATTLVQRFAAGYNVAGKNWRYQLGIAAQDNRSDNDVIKGSQQSFSQHVVNWSPRASVQLQLKGNQNMELNYSGQTTSPTIQQLQPLPDLRNPLIVRIGNPDLKPQFDHKVFVNFNKFQPKLKRGFSAGFTLNVTDRKLVQSIRNLAGGVQEIAYENLDGSFNVSGSLSGTFGIGEEGRMKIGSAVHYGQDPSFLNGVISKRTMSGLRPNVNVNYTLLERLSFEGDAFVDVSDVHYSIGGTNLTQVFQGYSCGLRYELPYGWYLMSDFHYQKQSTGAGLPVRDNRLLNAVITKSIFKDKSGQLRFAGYDILGSSTGIAQSVSDQSIETSQTIVPERLLLVTVSWNFRKTGGKSQNKN